MGFTIMSYSPDVAKKLGEPALGCRARAATSKSFLEPSSGSLSPARSTSSAWAPASSLALHGSSSPAFSMDNSINLGEVPKAPTKEHSIPHIAPSRPAFGDEVRVVG